MKKVTYETFKDILEDYCIEDIISELIEYDVHNYVFCKEEINSLIGGLLDNKTIHSFYLGKEKTKNAPIDKQEILNLIELYMNKYIILILIIILIIIYINDCNYENFISEEIDKNRYYNEKGELINHKNEERDEQEQAYKYIEPNDVVIELGGRYGTVSAIINYKLNNKKNHVVVEPDENIVPTFKRNRDLNNSGYYILPKIISNSNKKKIENGYSTHYIDSNNKDKYPEPEPPPIIPT
jgi:hypothetical protein